MVGFFGDIVAVGRVIYDAAVQLTGVVAAMLYRRVCIG